jgi:hypothetical protein
MAGMKLHSSAPDGCGEMQDALLRHVTAGEGLSAPVRAHLRVCPACTAELALLREVELALLEDVPEVAPPAALRGQVLGRAAAPQTTSRLPASRAPWLWLLGTAATLTGLLALGSLLGPSRGVAATLPDPAVVVATGAGVIVASNDARGTVTLVQDGRASATVRTGGRATPWFTEGVRLGDRVYLADAANDRVLELRSEPLELLRAVPVPDGVAGLTARSGPGGGRVYFKGARGAVGVLGGRQVSVATAPGMPLADVMDGVVLSGGRLWVTHHLSGEVYVLDPETLEVRGRSVVGGAPVALAALPGGVLVLDLKGRLLRLDADGQVADTWPLPGTPDKLTLNGPLALVSDRAGRVTGVNLDTGKVMPMTATRPMDIEALPDGTFMLAEGGRGVRVLGADLQTRDRLEH